MAHLRPVRMSSLADDLEALDHRTPGERSVGEFVESRYCPKGDHNVPVARPDGSPAFSVGQSWCKACKAKYDAEQKALERLAAEKADAPARTCPVCNVDKPASAFRGQAHCDSCRSLTRKLGTDAVREQLGRSPKPPPTGTDGRPQGKCAKCGIKGRLDENRLCHRHGPAASARVKAGLERARAEGRPGPWDQKKKEEPMAEIDPSEGARRRVRDALAGMGFKPRAVVSAVQYAFRPETGATLSHGDRVAMGLKFLGPPPKDQIPQPPAGTSGFSLPAGQPAESLAAQAPVQDETVHKATPEIRAPGASPGIIAELRAAIESFETARRERDEWKARYEELEREVRQAVAHLKR